MRCAGRPPIGNKPLNRVNVMLSDEDMKRVRSLGNGSISAGLRTALGCANAYGRKPRDTQTKSEQQADTIIEKQRVKIEELKTKLEQAKRDAAVAAVRNEVKKPRVMQVKLFKQKNGLYA